jgi:hypothetical protein
MTTVTIDTTVLEDLLVAIQALLPPSRAQRPSPATARPAVHFKPRPALRNAILDYLTIDPEEGVLVRDLTTSLGVPSNHVQNALNALLQDNLIYRMPDPEWGGRLS